MRLGQAECRHERDRGGLRGDAELLASEQRQDRALHADHAANEGVDRNEQSELPPVGPKAKCWRDRSGSRPERSSLWLPRSALWPPKDEAVD